MSFKIPPTIIKSRLFAALIVAIASSGLNLIGPPGGFAQSQSCDDVRFVFARGSGEALNGPSLSAWRDEIITAIGEASTAGFGYSFYELGSQSQRGHQYPAVPVSDSFDGYVNLVGAFFSGGEAFRFGESVEEGIDELRAYIDEVSSSCPKTKFVLGGYSQGAMVLSGSLHAFDPNKIIYVSTFGDPKLYLPEGKATFLGAIPKTPDACRGLNLSPYRISVPDCRAYEGILGSYRPYQPEDYAGKLGTWCNEKDLMCSSGASISDHTSYVSSNLYRDAARVIAQKLSRAFSTPSSSPWLGMFRKAKHKVAFVIDTTVSMVDIIDQYRDEAKILASRVKAEGGDVALIEYRDLQEDFLPRQLCDFSCDLNNFDHQIDNLAVAGGGDLPESALSALLYAMNSLDWQAGATKSIILLTDAIYHNPDNDGTTFQDVVRRSLEIDPVNIFVIAPGRSGVDYEYRKLAAATSGQVFTLGRVELSSVTDVIFNRPIARLSLASYTGQVGEDFYFDASASYSGVGDELRFDWDLDGDGQFELLDTDSALHHAYASETSHFLQVRVTDTEGRFSTMSAAVTVTSAPPHLATITQLKATPQSGSDILVTFQSDGEKVLLSTNDLVQGFVEVKNGSGHFVLRDVPAPLTVALTPYSTDQERGQSSTITVSPAHADEAAGELEKPDRLPANPENPDRPNAPTGPKDYPLLVDIPKAPDTGLASREYR